MVNIVFMLFTVYTVHSYLSPCIFWSQGPLWDIFQKYNEHIGLNISSEDFFIAQPMVACYLYSDAKIKFVQLMTLLHVFVVKTVTPFWRI